MADKMKISGLLKATALSVVLAAAVWFAGLVFNPPGLEMVLAQHKNSLPVLPFRTVPLRRR